PYINGTTYAQHLPNAYIYGMEGCDKPKDFKEGHGAAHGLDESVSIERLKRSMRIYARALLTLNEINW
ncbi:MAG: Xaa-His dipeptidase, partial [Clostridia bacterium]|nr:Xaa-His dipeptidase [Clostridia bacterium]